MRDLISDKILSVVHPELTEEWDYDKNYPLTPQKISYGSGKKVFWKCKKCKAIWNAKIYHRSEGSGCPECAKYPPVKNSIIETWPEVLKIWHPTKNEFLTPDMVGKGSDRKVWWKCTKEHEWKYWERYKNNISRKKDYVEKTLQANFYFISYALKQKDLRLVNENIKND